MTDLHSKLSNLKDFKIDSGTVSLWVVKSRTENKKMKYTCRWVKVDDDITSETYLAGNLLKIVKGTIGRYDSIENYEFIAKPEDKTFLSIPSSETNMTVIQEKVDLPGTEHIANHEKHIVNSTGYVIKIQVGQQYLYAYTKTAGTWNTKKVSSGYFSAFSGEKMIGLCENKIFKIEDHIDFILFEGNIFIANKRAFESAMNFKEGMKTRTNELIIEFNNLGLFTDTKPISKFVGEDARYLRSMSSIKDKGFYEDKDFMSNLATLNKTEGWGLDIDANGVITAKPENIKLILTLLNDLRLKSLLSGNIYDAPSSTKVESKQAKAALTSVA